MLHELFDGQLTTETATPKLVAITLPGPVPGIEDKEGQFYVRTCEHHLCNVVRRGTPLASIDRLTSCLMSTI